MESQGDADPVMATPAEETIHLEAQSPALISFSSSSSASTSPPTHRPPPLLRCIRFLDRHYIYDGLDRKGYDMLYRMIEMMSAIGWEAGNIHRSPAGLASSKAAIDGYIGHIEEGVEVFKLTMFKPWQKAQEATESLPELEGSDEVVGKRLRQWRWTLRQLHEPTGNDVRLFHLIKRHFFAETYERLAQLHLSKPQCALAGAVDQAKKLYRSLNHLEMLAFEADGLVRDLDNRLYTALQLQEYAKEKAHSGIEHQTEPCPELLQPVVYQRPNEKSPFRLNPMLSKSFGNAEEELIHRGYARSLKYPETNYTISANQPDSPQGGSNLAPLRLGRRRRGTDIPRIFTGSFSELEDQIRTLQIDKVETPETPSIQGSEDPVKVRDFASNRGISPISSPSEVALQQLEPTSSHRSEAQERYARDTRPNPHGPLLKGRSRTIDDTTGGLEAWLKAESTGTPGPDRDEMSAAGFTHLHRQNTI